ncbi:31977_t:CDS:2, partial [Gigaspora margarita]
MDFRQYISSFASDTNCKNWNVLNCLQYLKNSTKFKFTLDSKQDILDAFVNVFKKISESNKEFNERRFESSFDKNNSLHYNEKSSELKRKYNSKKDEPSEISRKSKSYKIRPFKDKSSISKTSAQDEIESESSDQTYNPPSDSEYSIKAKVKGSYYLDYFIVPGEIDSEDSITVISYE